MYKWLTAGIEDNNDLQGVIEDVLLNKHSGFF